LALLAHISALHTLPEQHAYLLFSRGVFDLDSKWLVEVIAALLSDRGSFDRLVAFFADNAYRQTDNRSTENKIGRITLDYTIDYTGTDEPLKWAWGERTHAGLEVSWRETQRQQLLFSLRTPYFEELLKHADLMNETALEFVLRYAKACDSCRYCVQTDKTGKRPLRSVEVGDKDVCPLFAGFHFRWYVLDDAIVDGIIAFLQFVDEVFGAGGVGEAALKRWAR